MADDDDFLDAIRGAPDDDDLRLVYADWLEERGDPRHLYLRVMVEATEKVLRGRSIRAIARRLRTLAASSDADWREVVCIRYDLIFESFIGGFKIPALKNLKIMTGRGLKELVDITAGAPAIVVRDVSLEAAEHDRRSLEHNSRARNTRLNSTEDPRPLAKCCRVSLRRAART